MSPETPKEEMEMLEAIAASSQSALADCVRRYWKDIYFLALTYLGRAEQAEEATQDVFLKVWNYREKLKEVDSFKDWLFIVARNHVFSEMRKSLHREPVELMGEAYHKESGSETLTPERQLEIKEYQQLLAKAISLLPEKRKAVFTLSREEGLSHQEIADRLDIKPSTVNDHMTLALNFIRTYVMARRNGSIVSLVMLTLLEEFTKR